MRPSASCGIASSCASGWTSSCQLGRLRPGQRLVVENCLLTAGCEIVYPMRRRGRSSSDLSGTPSGRAPLWFYLQRRSGSRSRGRGPGRPGRAAGAKRRTTCSMAPSSFGFEQLPARTSSRSRRRSRCLAGLLDWNGERNLFSTATGRCSGWPSHYGVPGAGEPSQGPGRLEEVLGDARGRLDRGARPVPGGRPARQAEHRAGEAHTRGLPPPPRQRRLPGGQGRQGPRCRRGPGRPRPGLRALEEDARLPAVAQGDGTGQEVSR